jgi:hypothetical protein
VKRGDEDDDEEGEGGMEVGMDMGNRKDVVAIVILLVAVEHTTLQLSNLEGMIYEARDCASVSFSLCNVKIQNWTNHHFVLKKNEINVIP